MNALKTARHVSIEGLVYPLVIVIPGVVTHEVNFRATHRYMYVYTVLSIHNISYPHNRIVGVLKWI